MMQLRSHNHFLEWVIRTILGSLCIYNLKKKPIVIFSTRRSGSTLLMEMIYSQPNVDYIDQPLALYRFNPYIYYYKNTYKTIISNLTDIAAVFNLRNYWKLLLNGKLRLLNHQWKIWDKRYSFIVNRLVIKELDATPLMDQLTKHFDAEIIYLLRHPIPVSLSIIKRRWGNMVEAYLRNSALVNEHLNDKQLKYANKILSNGTLLQKYVLEWILHNLVPLKYFQNRPWFTITYEELIMRPKAMSYLLCSKLNLPDPEGMYQTLLKPSRTTSKLSKEIIKEGKQIKLIEAWVSHLKDHEKEKINDMLSIFNIWVYEAENPYPNPELLHFGPINYRHRA